MDTSVYFYSPHNKYNTEWICMHTLFFKFNYNNIDNIPYMTISLIFFLKPQHNLAQGLNCSLVASWQGRTNV